MIRAGQPQFFMPPEAVERLRQQAPDILQELETPVWPPAGYPGAEADRALAERLGQMVAGYVESSSEDHPYLPFVRAPDPDGEEIDDSDDDDGDGGDPALVMLGMDADEIEDLRAGGESWWQQYWGEDEYQARLATGRVMADQLSRVCRDVDNDASEERGLVSYEGVSRTGATVGVMAARSDL